MISKDISFLNSSCSLITNLRYVYFFVDCSLWLLAAVIRQNTTDKASLDQHSTMGIWVANIDPYLFGRENWGKGRIIEANWGKAWHFLSHVPTFALLPSNPMTQIKDLAPSQCIPYLISSHNHQIKGAFKWKRGEISMFYSHNRVNFSRNFQHIFHIA